MSRKYNFNEYESSGEIIIHSQLGRQHCRYIRDGPAHQGHQWNRCLLYPHFDFEYSCLVRLEPASNNLHHELFSMPHCSNYERPIHHTENVQKHNPLAKHLLG
jgi:hypothetical protein